MGMNEVKQIERFFADLLTMHNQNDVEDAFFAAISNRPGDGTPPAGEVPEQSPAGEVPEQSPAGEVPAPPPRRHWLQLHEPSNKTSFTHIKHPFGSAIRVTKCGRTIVGVVEETIAHVNDADYPYAYHATVYEGDRIIFCIDSCARGICFLRSVLKSAMYEAIMVMSHKIRNRANRKGRAAERGNIN